MIKIVNITAKKLEKIVLMKEKMRREMIQIRRSRHNSVRISVCVPNGMHFKTNLILQY